MKYLSFHLVFILMCIFYIPDIKAQCNGIILNEIHYDNVGGDVGEFIEVAIPVGSGLTLSEYTVSLYNGGDGMLYDSNTLDMFTSGSSDASFNYYYWDQSGIQNGPDGFALDHMGTLCEFLSYEGSFLATNGPANGQLSNDIGVSEDSSTQIGESLQLLGMTWAGPFTNTKGDTNMHPPCSISNVTVSNDMCSGIDFVFDVSFDVSAGSGIYEVIDVSNANMVLATGSSSPITVTLSGNSSTTPFDINVWDQNDNSCIGSTVTLIPLDCSPLSSCSDAFLNEIHYDNTGPDAGEFIEVAIINGSGAVLSELEVNLYDGGSGVSYDSETLDNFNVGVDDGIYTYYSWYRSGIQNGPDGFSLSIPGSLCELLSYEGSFMATDGPANGQISTDIGLNENSSALGESLQLFGGTWTGPSDDTPGNTNILPCPNDWNLSGTVNNNQDYETPGTITSSQVIASTAIVDYDSALEIILNPNFETKLGATFEAFIDGCNNGGGGSNNNP